MINKIKMEKKYFKLKKEVKFVDIKPRTIIVCMNNKYYTYDKNEEISSNIINIIKDNLSEITVKYTINEVVLYKTSKKNETYIIDDVIINGFGDVKYNIKSMFSNVTVNNVYGNMLESTIIYWFINSEGDISQARLGKNEAADNFRIHIKNYYESKELARLALNKLWK